MPLHGAEPNRTGCLAVRLPCEAPVRHRGHRASDKRDNREKYGNFRHGGRTKDATNASRYINELARRLRDIE